MVCTAVLWWVELVVRNKQVFRVLKVYINTLPCVARLVC